MSQSKCQCRTCLRNREEGEQIMGVFFPAESLQMILCPICGNKRCPHANDHNNPCTNSNEPSQPGSAY